MSCAMAQRIRAGAKPSTTQVTHLGHAPAFHRRAHACREQLQSLHRLPPFRRRKLRRSTSSRADMPSHSYAGPLDNRTDPKSFPCSRTLSVGAADAAARQIRGSSKRRHYWRADGTLEALLADSMNGRMRSNPLKELQPQQNGKADGDNGKKHVGNIAVWLMICMSFIVGPPPNLKPPVGSHPRPRHCTTDDGNAAFHRLAS